MRSQCPTQSLIYFNLLIDFQIQMAFSIISPNAKNWPPTIIVLNNYFCGNKLEFIQPGITSIRKKPDKTKI